MWQALRSELLEVLSLSGPSHGRIGEFSSVELRIPGLVGVFQAAP